jgi:iron complex outermembrane receptor protein
MEIFCQSQYQITDKLSLFGDLQFRSAKADGVQANSVDDTFNFFNPKTGLYDIDTIAYIFYARANREPNRTDYEGGNVKPKS